MTSIAHTGGETILDEFPGHFDQGRWVKDPVKYGRNFVHRIDGKEIIDDRHKRFVLSGYAHRFNNPENDLMGITLGTTDDLEEANALYELGYKIREFGYDFWVYIEFEDRQMMLGWKLPCGAKTREGAVPL